MRIVSSVVRNRALTMVELLVVLAVFVVLLAVFFPYSFTEPRAPRQRIQCVNNLKQIGLATRVWEGDHGDKYPWSIPGTNGGTMEFVTGPNEWDHFQVMSNELSTPKVLICPADAPREWAATNFIFFSNSNLSYFLGLDVSDSGPQRLLSGDRNLTNGTPIKNSILEFTTKGSAGWTAEMHNKVGNILLSDGSVQQLSQTGLRQALANTGVLTNHLQMPITTQ